MYIIVITEFVHIVKLQQRDKVTMLTVANLRNSFKSSWLSNGSSVGHWLTSGIERFFAKWLESHGIKLVLRHVRVKHKSQQ